MIEAFPSEKFEALFVTDNSAREIMNRCDADLEALSNYHPLPELRNFFISRLQGSLKCSMRFLYFAKKDAGFGSVWQELWDSFST